MKNYLLSIVTVTKNCESTILETLDSVSKVKEDCIEYIIIDGASTDCTVSLILTRANLVDIFISEPDLGVYNAMNKAVSLANGRYILFINGDDVLVDAGFHVILNQISLISNQIICASTLVYDSASHRERLIPRPSLLPFFNSVPHPSAFVPREFLIEKPFREDLRIASDYNFFLESYITGASFIVLPVVTAIHRRGGISSNKEISQAECIVIRREQLGWRYPFFSALQMVYRFFKQVCFGNMIT